jgi:hypothetical protein
VPKVGEGLGKVDDEVVFISGLYNHIVNVGLDVLANLRLYALLDGLLVNRSSVLEAESQGHVAVDAVRRYERRVFLVRDLQGYLVIARVAVEEARQGTPSGGVNDLINVR